MTAYLITHRPRQPQFRSPRRATPTGCIVVHTAESALDSIADGVDSSAENVARFIANRSDYGSYHYLVDSDSRVHLVPFTAEAYGDGTGSNPWALHLSFACRTTDWATMPAARRRLTLRQGAKAAAEMARWVQRTHGVKVPARRITRTESEARRPGFISHGERDPGRRSDPGADFPWDTFLTMFAQEVNPRTGHKRIARAQELLDRALDRLSTGVTGWEGRVPAARRSIRQAKRDLPKGKATR